MTPLFVIFGVGLGTYAFRALAFALVGRTALPSWTDRPLAFVGPAALGALVSGMLFTEHGRAVAPTIAEAAASLAAVAVVRRTGNVAHGIAVAFPVLWAVAAVTG